MYSPTSSHSPTLKLAKDLAAILLPFNFLLTYIKAGAGAAQPRLTTCLGSGGVHQTDYHPSSSWHSTYCDFPPYGNGWCSRACSVVMLSGVDVPGYDNYLDMLTEASFCAGSECEVWLLSSFFICSKQSQPKGYTH